MTCPASGSCETILSSGYASIFGVPLSLFGTSPFTPKPPYSYMDEWMLSLSTLRLTAPFCIPAGMLAYGAVAGVSGWQAKTEQSQRSEAAKLAVLGGGTVLAATSSSLL